MNSNYQVFMTQWQKWRQEKPNWIAWSAVLIACLLFYLLIVLVFNSVVENLRKEINTDQTNAVWMIKAGQEILRLRQTAPRQQVKTNESAFTLINNSINEQGWTKSVTDVHQVEQNRVQVNFQSIAFNELVSWLQTLYKEKGIHVTQADLTRAQAGVVQANLVLEKTS